MPTYDDFISRSPPMSPIQSSSSYERFQDIVPQRSPTAVHIPRNRYSYSSFSEDETVDSDDERHSSPRRTSEAEHYLRKFADQYPIESQSRTPRPQMKRSSTGYSTHSNAPSLSHSPTSTAAGMSLPYTPASRPLPPRTNPTYSTSFKHSKSTDLVNPFPTMTQMFSAQPSLSKTDAFARPELSGVEATYVRNTIPLSSSGPASGSLKKLFRFNEMQAPPSASERF